MEHSEFESILEAARAGAEWAWSRLYGDLAGPLKGYAAARGSGDPDEVVGETFVQVVRNLPEFEGDWAGFRSWVFVIAHHRVVDQRRRWSRRPEVPIPEVREGGVGDVEEEALGDLGTRRVLQVLERLSPAQRDVVALRVIADLSLEEVARILGKRVGAVKSLQKRAFDRLRNLLDEAYPNPESRR